MMSEPLAKNTPITFYTAECASRCQLLELQKQEYEKARLNVIRARMAETEMEYRTREMISGALYLLQKPINVITALASNVQRHRCLNNAQECMPSVYGLDEALDSGQEALRTLQISMPESNSARRSSINVNEAIRDCLIISADRIDANGIEVNWRATSSLPMILSDDITLRVLLRILIENAIIAIGQKNAEGREVAIVSRIGADQMIEIGIQDSGPGISRACRTKIFEPFYTAWEGEHRHAGMGLAIASQIVADLGGDIEFRDSNKRGSNVLVSLPACYSSTR